MLDFKSIYLVQGRVSVLIVTRMRWFHFEDMDVGVKDGHFSVGEAEKEYNIEIAVKLV